MPDYADLKRRLADGFPTKQGFSGYYPDVATAVATMSEAAAAIDALEAERDALRKAAGRALDEACADDMDEWYAELRAALTPR